MAANRYRRAYPLSSSRDLLLAARKDGHLPLHQAVQEMIGDTSPYLDTLPFP